MQYEEMNKKLLENLGGKQNISSLTHCITRLRFKLKDESKAKTEKIKGIPGVVTVVQSAGQYQVVIGNHVPEVYNEFIEMTGIKTSSGQNEEKPKGILNIFIDVVSGIFTPVISVLMASGMIKGLNSLLVVAGLIQSGSGTQLILQATGDGLFYFFPIFLGYTAAKKFNTKPFIGMGIGAALVYPAIAAGVANLEPLYVLFEGTIFQSPVYITFLGIPVILMTYSSSVVPIILAVYFSSKLEKVLMSLIPKVVRGFFVPFFTLLLTVPLTFIVIGPIATWTGLLIGNVMLGIYNFSPVIAGALIGGFWQFFIMFGLHWGFVPIAMNNIGALGYDTIMIAGSATPLAMAGVVLGIFLKTKNKKLKEIAFPAFLSALFGITEPALYGVTLPRKKTFFTTSIAVAVAGALIGAFGSKTYTVGATGLFAIPNVLNPKTGIDMGFIGYVIAISAGFLIGLIGTLLFAYKNSAEKEPAEKANEEPLLVVDRSKDKVYELAAPVIGKTIPLDEIKDDAFSTGLLGKGVAVLPTEGKVFAPDDGTVTTLFPTHHAIGITTKDGIELLIHVGMDTVNLEGKYFEPKVQQGDVVKKGQVLLTFEKDSLEKEGYLTTTPIIITNTTNYLDVIETQEKEVDFSDTILTVFG